MSDHQAAGKSVGTTISGCVDAALDQCDEVLERQHLPNLQSMMTRTLQTTTDRSIRQGLKATNVPTEDIGRQSATLQALLRKNKKDAKTEPKTEPY